MSDIDYFLRRVEVERIVKLSRTEIYRRMDAGTFPRPIKLGSRAVRWRESDVVKWMGKFTGEGPQAP